MSTFLAGIGAACVQTRVIVWILGLELLKGVFGHGGYPYLRLRDNLLAFLLVVKG
jgi:hypothetical protein